MTKAKAIALVAVLALLGPARAGASCPGVDDVGCRVEEAVRERTARLERRIDDLLAITGAQDRTIDALSRRLGLHDRRLSRVEGKPEP